jgi:hypothetical protein
MTPHQTSSVTAFAAEYHLEFNAVLPRVAIGDEITVEGRVYDYTPATKRFHIKVNHWFTLIPMRLRLIKLTPMERLPLSEWKAPHAWMSRVIALLLNNPGHHLAGCEVACGLCQPLPCFIFPRLLMYYLRVSYLLPLAQIT